MVLTGAALCRRLAGKSCLYQVYNIDMKQHELPRIASKWGYAYRPGETAMRLRLSKMLVKQNVDFRHYLFSQSEASILRQISNCMRCESLAECDAYLADRHAIGNDDFRFCPNHALIRRLRKLRTTGNGRNRHDPGGQLPGRV